MASNRDYQLIFRALFDETQLNQEIKRIQSKLDKVTLNLGSDELKQSIKDFKQANNIIEDVADGTENLKKKQEDLNVTYQVANSILSKTLDIMTSMIGQVFELDDAITEFRKVSDLSGQELDNYVDTMSELGLTVGRTGKPKCLSLGVGMINLRHTTVQNPVTPKAYLTTMAA